MQRIAQRAGVAPASSHALQLKGVESSAALFRNAQISKLGPVVMARRTTPISSFIRAGQLQRTLHSSAYPRALFGLFGGGNKEETAQQSDKAATEEEISEEEAARQDEAEATAVVNRTHPQPNFFFRIDDYLHVYFNLVRRGRWSCGSLEFVVPYRGAADRIIPYH